MNKKVLDVLLYEMFLYDKCLPGICHDVFGCKGFRSGENGNSGAKS